MHGTRAQVAISYELNRLGVNPTRASEAAAHFTDRAQPGRAAGKLFPMGKTMLIVAIDATSVVNVNESELASYGPAVVVDCGEIVERVTRALNGTGRRAA